MRAPVLPEVTAKQRFMRFAILALLIVHGAVALAPLVAPKGPWGWGYEVVVITAVATALYGVAYLLNGLGRTRHAALLLVAAMVGAVLGPILWTGSVPVTREHGYVALNVVAASFLLSWRSGIVVAAIDGVVLAAVAATSAAYDPSALIADLLILGMYSALIVTFAALGEHTRRRLVASREDLARTLSDMRAMLDTGPDGMMILRQDGEIIRVNHRAWSWGKQHMQVEVQPGDRLPNILPATAWARVSDLLARAAEQMVASAELRVPVRAGTLWLEVHVRRVEGPEPQFAAQMRDTTQVRRAVQQERTAYRERVDLLKLREIERARARLLNRASHEMRTPMTPLRLQVAVLQRRLQHIEDERTHHSLDSIKRNLTRLSRLVDDLLDASTMEAEAVNLHVEPVAIAAVVRQETEVYRPMAEERGLHLSVESKTNATLKADPRRLAQVFSNLVGNALKFAKTEIRVTTRLADGEVVVTVADDGLGFEPEKGEQLWLPFAQIHADEKAEAGSGLGLYLCRGIVELHGGTIWAESIGPGHGASFSFSLPLDDQGRAPAATPMGPVPSTR